MKMFSYTDGGTEQPHTQRDPLQTRLAAVAELDYIMSPQTETEIDLVSRMTTRKLELGAHGAPGAQDTAPPPAPPAPSSPPPSPEQITRAAMLAVLTSLATDNRIAGETRCRAATMYLQHTVSASKTQTLTNREERLATATQQRSPKMTTARMRKATRPVTATSGPKPPTPTQRTTRPSKIKTTSSSTRSKASKPSARRKSRAAT